MTVVQEAAAATVEEIREEVVAWLRDNLPPQWVEAIDSGDDAKLREARKLVDYGEWCARLGEAGWATPTWPAALGFRGLNAEQARAVNEELGRYKVHRSFNIIGLGMGGPTVMHWGNDEQKKKLAEHKIKMNGQALFGAASESLTGGASGFPIRTTPGIMNIITTNLLDAGGTLTDKTLETFARMSFARASVDKPDPPGLPGPPGPSIVNSAPTIGRTPAAIAAL